MNRKNTYKKGEEFEQRTKKVLDGLLHNSELKVQRVNDGELWIVPKDSNSFHHKKYSYNYGGKTEIDVSIEGNEPHTENSFLIVIECKCYDTPIKIEKIQAFSQKITDLQATKGIFVTNIGYQKGALESAKAHNIALVRINDKNETLWDLRRIGYKKVNLYFDFKEYFYLEELPYPSVIIDIYICSTSLVDYFCKLLDVEDVQLGKVIPYLTDLEIKQKAMQFLGNKPYCRVPTETLKLCAIRENILIEDDKKCYGLMGKCDFLNKKVMIDVGLKQETNKGRYRFTLAHELGHAYLHQHLLKNVIAFADDMDVLEMKNSERWEQRLEIQANHFASFLLIPENPLINYYMEIKKKLNYAFLAPIRLDDNATSIHDCKILFSVLANIFGVSKEAIMYRLLDEHLLDVGNTNPFMKSNIVNAFGK